MRLCTFGPDISYGILTQILSAKNAILTVMHSPSNFCKYAQKVIACLRAEKGASLSCAA